jgi:hypothetical protein
MNDIIETVRIVAPVTPENPLGFVVINRSDLTDAHELFDKPAKPPRARKD